MAFEKLLRTRRRIGGAVLCAVLAVATALGTLAPSAAQDVPLRFFQIGTGTTGGTYFPIGGIIANAISNPPGARPCERGGSCGVPGLIAVAQATSGSVENIELLRAGTIASALSQADIAYWAYTGTGTFAEEPPFEDLRAIANLYPEAVHLVVRADSDIHDVNDLKGKIVSIGEEGSGTLVDVRAILKAYGLSEQKHFEPRYLKPGPAADRLAAGEIDAFFIVGGAPVAAVSDARARVPIRLVPFDDPIAERLSETLPYFTRTVIPEGSYTGVDPTPTLGVGAQWVVRADVPEEVVHGITRALWHESTQSLLANGHPRGANIQLETALEGIAVPLHPGAERFYREMGLIEDPDAAEPESSTD